jgi:hypothetical protein
MDLRARLLLVEVRLDGLKSSAIIRAKKQFTRNSRKVNGLLRFSFAQSHSRKGTLFGLAGLAGKEVQSS